MSSVAESQNFIRLQFLLANFGEKVLRKQFCRRYKTLAGHDWITDSLPNKIGILKNLYGNKYQKLPENHRILIETCDINQWDITLLIGNLLQFQDDGNDALGAFLEENDHVKKLRDIRNNLAHRADKEMSNEEFMPIWKDAATILQYFGECAEDIDNIRTTSKLNGIEFIDEDFLNEENMMRAKSLKEKGNGAFVKNQITEAIKLYSQALLLAGLSKQERGILCSNRSQAYLMILSDGKKLSADEINENISRALEDAKMAIQLRPNWWKGYAKLGKVHQFKKEFVAAVSWFEIALSLDPTLESVRNARAECKHDQIKAKIQEHMDPTKNFISREEILNNFAESRGQLNHMFGGNASKYMTEFMKMTMNNGDPSVASHGWVHMAHNYKIGDNVPRNLEKSAMLFKKAADVGNVEGIYNIGLMTLEGEGVNRDVPKAMMLFEQAARTVPTGIPFKDLGISHAKYMLGKCYNDGVGYHQDYAKAIHWYRQASFEGLGDASNNLNAMFVRGEGVIQNIPKSMQYAKLAVEQGCTIAMTSLYWGYLALGDVDQAEIWFQRCLDTGYAVALLQKTDFYAKLKLAREEMLETRKLFPEPIYQSTVPTYKLIQRMRKNNLPESGKRDEAYREGFNCQPTRRVDGEESLVAKIIASTEVIHQRAKEGSVYATKLYQALNYIKRVMENLKSPAPQQKLSTILEDFAKAQELAQFLTFIPGHLNNQFQEIVNKGLQSKNSTEEYFARVCYTKLLRNSRDEAEKFSSVSKLIFPNKSYFYDIHSCDLGFLRKYTEGAEVAQQGIDRFPDICEHYYNKAVHLKLGWNPKILHPNLEIAVKENTDESNIATEEIIGAYKKFLEKAPKDHRKIPESYYSMALISGLLKDLESAERYYQLGLKSEKNMLPCFLPYDSTTKPIVESIRNIHMRFEANGRQKLTLSFDSLLEPDEEEIEEQRKLQSTSPKRVIICRAHRESCRDLFRQISSKTPTNFHLNTDKPLHSARAPKRKDRLEEITFEQMDPTKDHVYKGRVISLTIMEDSLFKVLPSIHSVVMDKNGDFQRIYIYNLNHDDQQNRKNLKYGSKIQVKNPYHRLTSDYAWKAGQAIGTGIRVDDPKSLVFVSEGVGSICRFCWKENADLTCSKCKRAMYCSKECQIEDWKLLLHKRICTSNTFGCI